MTTTRERREARADRLRGWADKRETAAAAVFKANEPYTTDYAFNTDRMGGAAMTAATYLAGSPDGGRALPLCAEHRDHLAWRGETMALRGTPGDIAAACSPDWARLHLLRVGPRNAYLPCAACDAEGEAKRLAVENRAHVLQGPTWPMLLAALRHAYDPPADRDLAGLAVVWIEAYRAEPSDMPCMLLETARRRATEVLRELADVAS